MSLGWTQQAAVVILSGGGAAAIYTLVKAYLAIRGSADTREATAIAHLERWRKDAEERAAWAWAELEAQRDLTEGWRRRAGVLEHRCLIHGIDITDLDTQEGT